MSLLVPSSPLLGHDQLGPTQKSVQASTCRTVKPLLFYPLGAARGPEPRAVLHWALTVFVLFHVAVTKHFDRSNLRDKGVCDDFRLQSSSLWELRQQGLDPASHIEMAKVMPSFPDFISSAFANL